MQPPPRPIDSGMVTPMHSMTAMAASTAFPPAANTSLQIKPKFPKKRSKIIRKTRIK